jgi:hypothetical protein
MLCKRVLLSYKRPTSANKKKTFEKLKFMLQAGVSGMVDVGLNLIQG